MYMFYHVHLLLLVFFSLEMYYKSGILVCCFVFVVLICRILKSKYVLLRNTFAPSTVKKECDAFCVLAKSNPGNIYNCTYVYYSL